MRLLLKKRIAFIGFIMLGIIAFAVLSACTRQDGRNSSKSTSTARQSNQGVAQPAAPARMPANYETAPIKLAPTLPPEKFMGKTREAYEAVAQIPETIAQLPCYCYCDESVGHKSLHSCFEDTHAASCIVCVREALTAYKLQKEQGLTPAQIRDRIVAEYSKQ